MDFHLQNKSYDVTSVNAILFCGFINGKTYTGGNYFLVFFEELKTGMNGYFVKLLQQLTICRKGLGSVRGLEYEKVKSLAYVTCAFNWWSLHCSHQTDLLPQHSSVFFHTKKRACCDARPATINYNTCLM